jgi:hypothetical protein
MFYSATTNAWYSPDFRDVYEQNGTWPADAKEYPDSVYAPFRDRQQPDGKVMQPDANGDPVLVDAPGPTDAELATAAKAQRDVLLAASDWTQLRDVDDATAAAWAPYRQALRDLTSQPGFPRTITWPVAPQ